MIYLSFFYHYVGPIVFIVYVLSIIHILINIYKTGLEDINNTEFYLYLFVSIFYVTNIIRYNYYDSTYVFRYFFGVLVFYLYFKNNYLNKDILLLILSLSTIIEAILVNTVLPIDVLPNYMDSAGNIEFHKTHILGIYQRVYGFGGNPSITGSILVVMLALQDSNSKIYNLNYFSTSIAILLTVSGTSYLLYIVYLILKISVYKIVKILFGMILLYFIPLEYTKILFSKISFEYIKYLLNYKYIELTEYFVDYTTIEFIFGNYYDKGVFSVSSDFGLIGLIKTNGIIGLSIIIIVTVININRHNIASIILMFLTLLHYPAIFSLPGQIIYAYILNYKRKNISNI